jgi:ferrous iron transport protein A
MPLMLSSIGVPVSVKRLGSNDAMRRRIEELGFTEGTQVTVVSHIVGNLIVRVKDSRIALSRDLACSIFVEQFV